MNKVFLSIALILSIHQTIKSADCSDMNQSVAYTTKMSESEKKAIVKRFTSLFLVKSTENYSKAEEIINELELKRNNRLTPVEDKVFILLVLKNYKAKMAAFKEEVMSAPGYGLTQSIAITTASADKKLNIAHTHKTEIDLSDLEDAKIAILDQLAKKREALKLAKENKSILLKQQSSTLDISKKISLLDKTLYSSLEEILSKIESLEEDKIKNRSDVESVGKTIAETSEEIEQTEKNVAVLEEYEKKCNDALSTLKSTGKSSCSIL